MVRKQFKTNIDEELLKKLKFYKAEHDIPMNVVIEELLKKFFKGEIKLSEPTK